jgi:hypothetical protein
MRAMVMRQRLGRSAVLLASVALLAACGVKANHDNAGGTDAVGDTAGLTAGSLLVSDGTNTVTVGGRAFTFPTTVTDAAFSPDGSRIVFVNGDGNIATARVDGSGLRVLTKPAAGAVRSHPTWSGAQILFAEKSGSKPSTLRAVFANGSGAPGRQGEVDAELGGRSDDNWDENTSGSTPTGLLDAGIQKTDLVAFQRQGAKGGEVWLADLNQREPTQSKVVDGTEPALAPDAQRIAYVDGHGQIEIVDTFKQGAKPVQVTFGVAGPTHLTWAPDGARIAFETAADIESVSTAVAAGTTTNPTKQESAKPGVPNYLPPARDQITRIAGSDPIETSIAASQVRWPTIAEAHESEGFQVQARGVLLAGTANLPAMLAGAQMVDAGPLLFTSGATLNSHTAAEIKRVLGKVDTGGFVPTVTILGGTDVVSTQAENAVKAMGYATDRVAGKDPYAMAVTAAGKPADAEMVLVADAADVASYASAISDLGGYSNQTVLLTNGSTMPDGVKTFLNGLKKGVKVYGLGSGAQAALASSWSGKPALSVTAVNGPTASLLGTYAGYAKAVVIVDSSSTTDVIAAIGLARGYGAPVLALDTKAALDDGVKAWLDGASGTIDNVMIVDSKGAVSADFDHSIAAVLGGPLGVSSNTNPKAPPLT